MSFAKWIIIVMAINIVLFAGGIRVINDANYNFIGKFIDTGELASTNTTVLNESFTDTLPTSYSESGGDGLFSFIDSIKSIVSFLIFIVNIVFTPLGLFFGAGLPWQVGLMIGVPLVVGGAVGIAYFIRGLTQ